jgi:hypothetical protein
MERDFGVQYRLAIEFDVDGRSEFDKPLVHVPAAGDQARFVPAHVGESASSLAILLNVNFP